jgi:cell wall-associated NlpC family hydrolase
MTTRTMLGGLLMCLALASTTPARAYDTTHHVSLAGDGTPHAVRPYVDLAQELIGHGMAYLGIRYRQGGTSPETGFDCSGLVQRIFLTAAGVELPRTAAAMARLGKKIGREDLQPGDLVFFNTMRRTFSHVGIYVGDGRFLHAPSSGGVVRMDAIGEQYWTSRFNGARRLLAGLGG